MSELYYTDRENARRYVDIVASLSQLGEPHFTRPMMLSNYSGINPTMTSIDQVAEELERVDEVARGLAGHPGEYMRAIVKGTRTVLSILRKEGQPYRDLVRGILEIDFVPIPDSEAVRLRTDLSAGLGEMGFTGSLEQKVESWLSETSLTGQAVIDFGKQILGKARSETEAKVVKLPPGEGVDSFTGVRDVFYSGRSGYTGNFRGWLHFNIDKNWQKDVFIQVLCHEAYPGHQSFYALWDSLYQDGNWPLEAAFYQRNAPTNPIFEGGPEVAMHFIGWDEGESRAALALRMGQVLKDLGRISMNNACLWCNLGEMSKEQALDYMVEYFVLRDDAERAYGFFTNPLSRTHYPQYYYGRRIVDKAFALMEGSEAGRQRFWDIIYRTPHTTSTFIKAISTASETEFNPFTY
jgi:hypothetical protein